MNESDHEVYRVYENFKKHYSKIFADINMIITESTHHCHKCKTFFVFHNKLHNYICTECRLLIQSLNSSISENSKLMIIKSVIKLKKLSEYSFRK